MGFPSLKMVRFKYAVAAVAALALLGMAEFALRWMKAPAGGYDRPPGRLDRSAGIPAPDDETRPHAPGWPDHAPAIAAKRPDEFRVVVLGDAPTLAAGVDIEAIITGLQQARSVEYLPDVRVIRLAVRRADHRQYSQVLEELGPALQPDMVLVPQPSEDGIGRAIHIRGQTGPEPSM